ncbi:hypothetical protein LCGC14_1216920 [marine sediment metagenome]|uniref:Uncharacterized protein n=1 Tax=marine sediment metagenome TaxID=412755 RepID=A0A0F9PGZ1_9ZZZZ
MADETTADTPTVESINADIERLTGDLVEAQQAHSDALETLEKGRSKASIEQLLEMAEGVRTASKGVENAESAITVAKRGLDRLEWESKTAALREVLTPIGSIVRDAVNDAIGTFAEFNVTGLVVTVNNIGQPDMETSVKPTGPDIPKPPGGVKRSGGGGKRASHSVTENGATMTPREYVAAHSEDSTDIIRAYLGGDTSHKVNLTHEAERIAKKLGHTFS